MNNNHVLSYLSDNLKMLAYLYDASDSIHYVVISNFIVFCPLLFLCAVRLDEHVKIKII